MFSGLGTTLFGVVLAAPWFPRTWWLALVVGLFGGVILYPKTGVRPSTLTAAELSVEGVSFGDSWLSNAVNNRPIYYKLKIEQPESFKLTNIEPLTNLRGAAVLVTGASMGIGEHVAYEFAKHGARLIITARSEDKLKEVVHKCKQLGASQAYYFVADMANMNHINNLVEFTKQKFRDRLDYLVLNHIMQNKATFCPTEDVTSELENFRKLYDVNFFSYVHLASRFLHMLEHSRGHLTVVSSVAAKHSFPFFVPYASSKSAVESYFTGLRQELAINSSKISLTIAVLGRIDTPGQRRAFDGQFRHRQTLPAEKADVTADIIVRGTYDRIREIYHPYWMAWPISTFVNLPFVRQLFEKVLQFTMQRSNL